MANRLVALTSLSILLLQCCCSPAHLPRSEPVVRRASIFEGIPDPPPDPDFDEGSGAHGSQEPTKEDRDYWSYWWSRAELADSVGANNAARHMFHYLNNTGKDLLFSTDHMMYDQGALFGNGLASGVVELVSKEAKAAYDKATVGEGKAVTFSTAWQAPGELWAVESLDWFLAVGGFSWSVAGVVTAKKDGDEYQASLRYVVYAVDRYNWDIGKGLGIPGVITITDDEDLGRLHRVGLAREYNERGTSKLHTIDPYDPYGFFFHFSPPDVGILPYSQCIYETCAWIDEVRPLTLHDAPTTPERPPPFPPDSSGRKPWVFQVRNSDDELIYHEDPALIDSLKPSGLQLTKQGQKSVNTECIEVAATAGHQVTGLEAPLGTNKNFLRGGFPFYFGYDVEEFLNGTPKDSCSLALFDSKGCRQSNGTPVRTKGIWIDNLPYTVVSYQVSSCEMVVEKA